MHTAAVLPTFTYPGVAGAMLALSKARRAAHLSRRWSAELGEFGTQHAPASAAAFEASAREHQAIVDRITRDLAAGIYENNRQL